MSPAQPYDWPAAVDYDAYEREEAARDATEQPTCDQCHQPIKVFRYLDPSLSPIWIHALRRPRLSLSDHSPVTSLPASPAHLTVISERRVDGYTHLTLSCGHEQPAVLADGAVRSCGDGFVGVMAQCERGCAR